MKPQVGMIVQYMTHITKDADRRTPLAKPIQVGPLAAVVTGVNEDGSLNLLVHRDRGRGSYPALNVTGLPTTPVQHWWQFIPHEAELIETTSNIRAPVNGGNNAGN